MGLVREMHARHIQGSTAVYVDVLQVAAEQQNVCNVRHTCRVYDKQTYQHTCMHTHTYAGTRLSVPPRVAVEGAHCVRQWHAARAALCGHTHWPCRAHARCAALACRVGSKRIQMWSCARLGGGNGLSKLVMVVFDFTILIHVSQAVAKS